MILPRCPCTTPPPPHMRQLRRCCHSLTLPVLALAAVVPHVALRLVCPLSPPPQEALTLRCCSLKSEGVEKVCSALHKNIAVRCLDLSNNSIGDEEGCAALAGLLAHNLFLEELRLVACGVTEAGAKVKGEGRGGRGCGAAWVMLCGDGGLLYILAVLGLMALCGCVVLPGAKSFWQSKEGYCGPPSIPCNIRRLLGSNAAPVFRVPS